MNMAETDKVSRCHPQVPNTEFHFPAYHLLSSGKYSAIHAQMTDKHSRDVHSHPCVDLAPAPQDIAHQLHRVERSLGKAPFVKSRNGSLGNRRQTRKKSSSIPGNSAAILNERPCSQKKKLLARWSTISLPLLII